jgi:hypothetical protein
MDPRENPYTPNAGARPPALAGREAELERFDVLLHRLARGHAEQSMIITGLRGVGKTVLLDEFRRMAEAAGWASVEAEITKTLDFPARIAQLVRRALLQIAPKERWKDRTRNAAAVLKSFSLTVKPDGSISAGLGVEALRGLGDTGDLSEDLSDLLVALGEAAEEGGKGVVFLLDEIQFLDAASFEALIAALHKTVRRSLPVTLSAAGLPQMPRLAGEAKSYSERLFRFPTIGELPRDAAREALAAPAAELMVEYSDAAMAFVIEYTQGYPYFLQEYGKVLWDEASTSPIDVEDAREALPLVEARLDEGFFRVRAERTTPLELQYLRAMAELGTGPQRAGDVAAQLGKRAEQLGPTRSRLIDKGLLYTPSHGLAAFTVPQFDRYLRRTYEIVPLK